MRFIIKAKSIDNVNSRCCIKKVAKIRKVTSYSLNHIAKQNIAYTVHTYVQYQCIALSAL